MSAQPGRPKRAWMFPGQGSQKRGAGDGLFERFPALCAIADRVLGYSVRELCLTDPDGRLHQTRWTQPALYVVNALHYCDRICRGEAPPDIVLGHSLGEYNALLAAGVFDFETGLRLVNARAEAMSAQASGTMAAVIGIDVDRVAETMRRPELADIDVANINAPHEVVVSGAPDGIARAKVVFEREGARVVPLNVSAAFHSRWMEAAANAFAGAVDAIEFRAPQIPVIANVTAQPVAAESVGALLKAQVSGSVRWLDSIRYILSLGAFELEEIGHGRVLTRLAQKIVDHDSRSPARPGEGGARSPVPAPRQHMFQVSPESLGEQGFRGRYGLARAYLAGGMYKGIASKELVIRMGRRGYLAFYGAGGVPLATIERDILAIQQVLERDGRYGVNFLARDAERELALADLCLRLGVHTVEASAFVQVTPALVKYRLRGLRLGADGRVMCANRIIAKLSRPEVAEAFLSPAPPALVAPLLAQREVLPEQAEWAKSVPMADDICVEADSGGHTDMGVLSVLLPAMIRLRDREMRRRGYADRIGVGAAGGIGTAESAAAAFVLGADFILTGSVNQCTVEAGTSERVKDILETLNVQDMTYAPAGDMFELGAKIQVVKRGLLFASRAARLFELWKFHDGWEAIGREERTRIEKRFFGRSFEEVYAETERYYLRVRPEEIERARTTARHKMALVFRWYFVHTARLALAGSEQQASDYQIHCGPAVGAFNQWVKGSELEGWRARHVDAVADRIMEGAARYLHDRIARWTSA